eukprot:349801-Chlamydomonas_euryale.AAC.67
MREGEKHAQHSTPVTPLGSPHPNRQAWRAAAHLARNDRYDVELRAQAPTFQRLTAARRALRADHVAVAGRPHCRHGPSHGLRRRSLGNADSLPLRTRCAFF